jgi:phosphocarrier protein
MVERTIKIINRLGIHARPAALLVQTAGKYRSRIVLRKDGVEVNAKSIMGVMMLAAAFGSQVVLRADGPDEKEALLSLVRLIDRKFGED